MRSSWVWVLGMAAVLSHGGAAQAAATPQQKCQKAKLTAASKRGACLNKQRNDVLLGEADESTECEIRFQTALSKADAKATAALTSCRYIDNGDGTLTDLNTGLQWEKKDDLGGIHDKDNIHSWASSGATPNGMAFTAFLGTLNDDTSSTGFGTPPTCFTGHCDWRLPTLQELAGIVDLTQGNCRGGSGACIDPAFGPTQGNFYWSATTYLLDPREAFHLFFFNGGVFAISKLSGGYVRAVRGGW